MKALNAFLVLRIPKNTAKKIIINHDPEGRSLPTRLRANFIKRHLNIVFIYTLIKVNMQRASINFMKQTGEGALSSSH